MVLCRFVAGEGEGVSRNRPFHDKRCFCFARTSSGESLMILYQIL